MAMVAACRRANGSSPSAWSKSLRPSGGAVLHSSCEPGELTQWLTSYDVSTVNIVLAGIIIIIIFFNFLYLLLLLYPR